MLDQSLAELAKAYGLELSYYDDSFRLRHSPPEGIIAVLRVLGAPIETMHEARGALREFHLARWRRRVEPVILSWNGNGGEFIARLPAPLTPCALGCHLELEGGESRSWSAPLGDGNLTQTVEVEGQRFHQYRVLLPVSLPLGYHRLCIETPGQHDESLVLAAAAESYRPAEAAEREWGVFLPLYALRTQRDCGVGDFTDLGDLLAWAQEQGGALVGTLPLLASFIHQEEKIFEPSPYAPASRLFWNEIFLDLERIPELARCPAAQKRLAAADYQRTCAELRRLPQVDYQRTMALKRQVLMDLAAEFFARPSTREEAFRSFSATHPRLEDYARFRAACERHATSWWNWPARQRQATLLPGDYDDAVMRFHLYVQWQAHEQLTSLVARAGARGGLYLDLPLGSSSDSYDVWRDRAVFALGASAGAPADGFASRGQNWGFPPIHPERQREHGYRYLRDVLANVMHYAHTLRLDHLMGLHRLFFIPGGMDASAGVYVRYPHEEHYAVYCLESQRHKVILAGEDLGIVPATVRPAMERHRVDQLFVAQFQYRPMPDGSGPPVPANAVASLNTHDLAPYAAFCRDLDLRDRSSLGLMDPVRATQYARDRQGMRDALISFFFRESTSRRLFRKAWRRLVNRIQPLRRLRPLPWSREQELAVLQRWLIALGESPARVVLVNLEDLWLCPDPQNIPGTWKERPNWRRRATYALEEFAHLPEVIDTLRELNATRQRQGQPFERAVA